MRIRLVEHAKERANERGAVRITYDPKYDVLYLKVGEAEKVLCKEVDEDITLDLNAQGKLVGIEILSASEHMDLGHLLPVEMSREVAK